MTTSATCEDVVSSSHEVVKGGVMCAEGMVGGATSQFIFLCDSSGKSGHGLNPQNKNDSEDHTHD